ncbi:MAG: serpin family protein, partial [Candidatus Micrarchaeota archaeon]|nr:serpin family protein [Candidatus Micrarchaeota archaeon]
AATGVAVVATGISNGPTIPQFDANHPFIFFIIEKHTGTILFMGRLSSPNISN